MGVVLYQGASLQLYIPILNGSAPVDLTTVVDIRVKLYTLKSGVKTLAFLYSKVQPLSNYGICMMETGTGNTNVVQVVITREQSVNFIDGILQADVLLEFTDTTFPPTNKSFQTFNFTNLGQVLVSGSVDIPLP